MAVLIFAWFVFNIGCWLCHAYLSRELSIQWLVCSLLLAVLYMHMPIGNKLRPVWLCLAGRIAWLVALPSNLLHLLKHLPDDVTGFSL